MGKHLRAGLLYEDETYGIDQQTAIMHSNLTHEYTLFMLHRPEDAGVQVSRYQRVLLKLD